MGDPNFQKTLEELHEQLQHTKTVDDQEAEVLRDLMSHIEEVLQRSHEPAYPRNHTLTEHLRDSAEYFEVSHPNITTLLRNVIATLRNIGI